MYSFLNLYVNRILKSSYSLTFNNWYVIIHFKKFTKLFLKYINIPVFLIRILLKYTTNNAESQQILTDFIENTG